MTVIIKRQIINTVIEDTKEISAQFIEHFVKIGHKNANDIIHSDKLEIKSYLKKNCASSHK